MLYVTREVCSGWSKISGFKEPDGGPHMEGFAEEIKFDPGHKALVGHFQVRTSEGREETKGKIL